MKILVQTGAAALLLLPFTGCVAIKVPQSADSSNWTKYETTSIGESEVTGVEPLLERNGDEIHVSVNLLGTFDIVTTTYYNSSDGNDEFIAAGFFPGVMSCSGEYRDCLQNGAAAFFYNLVFAGLPTLHGLLLEPLIPYFPQQTETIVGRSAFLKSTLIGFSRYSKRAENSSRQEVRHNKVNKQRLEDATISAPDLGLESSWRGQPLRIPVDRLSSSGGAVKIKLSLPYDHPLKKAMADFENVKITIQCGNM